MIKKHAFVNISIGLILQKVTCTTKSVLTLILGLALKSEVLMLKSKAILTSLAYSDN